MAGAFQTLGLGEGRKLGTPAGDLERQARRLRRKGYDREAGPLMAQAAILRAQNRGIQSSEAITEKMRLEEQQAEEMVRQQQNAVLGTGAAPATPTTPATTGSAPPLPTAPSPTAPAGQTTAPTGQPMIPEVRKSFAQIASDRQRELALAGNFGEAAKARAEKGVNLDQRQSLFAEMRKAGVKSALDGDFLDRAKALGVDERGFEAALDRLQPQSTTSSSEPPPAAPPFGRALALNNIAEKGFQGAAADYFQRKAAEESAKQAKTIDKTMAKPVAYSGSPTSPGTAPRGEPIAAAIPRPQFGQAAPRPAAEPARASAIPQFNDDEDFGGELFPAQRGMGYNEPAVAKVRGVTSKVDAAMNRAAGAAGERVRETVGQANRAGQAVGEVAASNFDKVKALTERTNKASKRASNRLEQLIR